MDKIKLLQARREKVLAAGTDIRKAISSLIRQRRAMRISPLHRPLGRRDKTVEEYVYGRYLAKWLIGIVRRSEEDPMTAVRKAYYMMDDWLLASKSPQANLFLKRATMLLGDIRLEMQRDGEHRRASYGEWLVREAMRQEKEAEHEGTT